MAKALDLRDLHNGSLNTLEDSNATGTTGDPRRTDAVASLRRTQSDAYAPNTIGNRTEYIGIVVAQYEIDFPGFTDKAGLLRQYQMGTAIEDKETYDNIEKTRKTAYKVFIPETDPRPIPGFNTLNDPVTLSLPEAYANIAGLEAPIAPGSAVAVTYDNPKHLGAPIIIRIVTDKLTVGSTNLNNRGCKKWESTLAHGWRKRNNVALPMATAGGGNRDYRNQLVPDTIEGCQDAANGFKPKANILDEEIVTSTIVRTYKGNLKVKGKKSFIERVERAHKELTDKGHPGFTIADSLRSYEGQRWAYMNLGQPGQTKWDPRTKRSKVAHPCGGYHTEGQAIDLNFVHMDDILAHGPIYQALYNAGLRRINREFWHWSLGEASGHKADGTGGHARDKVFSAGVTGSPADTFRPGAPPATSTYDPLDATTSSSQPEDSPNPNLDIDWEVD